MLIVPFAPRIYSFSPFQASIPASVTTNAGTPILAKNQPWMSPSSVPTATAAMIAETGSQALVDVQDRQHGRGHTAHRA